MFFSLCFWKKVWKDLIWLVTSKCLHLFFIVFIHSKVFFKFMQNKLEKKSNILFCFWLPQRFCIFFCSFLVRYFFSKSFWKNYILYVFSLLTLKFLNRFLLLLDLPCYIDFSLFCFTLCFSLYFKAKFSCFWEETLIFLSFFSVEFTRFINSSLFDLFIRFFVFEKFVFFFNIFEN